MPEIFLSCISCSRRQKFWNFYKCRFCNGSLEIIYNYRKIKKNLSLEPDNKGLLKYIDLLPVKRLVSLGEARTPLIISRNIKSRLPLKVNLYFKLESLNPTGSFKDRGSCIKGIQKKAIHCPQDFAHRYTRNNRCFFRKYYLSIFSIFEGRYFRDHASR